jgi:hypothetical protein
MASEQADKAEREHMDALQRRAISAERYAKQLWKTWRQAQLSAHAVRREWWALKAKRAGL